MFTGQEPYSAALILSRVAHKRPGFDYRILATDVSRRVLEQAATGIFAADDVAQVPAALRSTFFEPAGPDRFQVVASQRARMHFAPVNLAEPPYRVAKGLDAIFCRNVLIYFDDETKRRVVNGLIDRLNPADSCSSGTRRASDQTPAWNSSDRPAIAARTLDMPTRVLIVDDSPVARHVLTTTLESDPDIEVVGQAGDPYEAAALLPRLEPDVLTLDIEMPRMDGLTFLDRLMHQRPIPVVICSTLTAAGSRIALKALQIGAVEVIHKPSSDLQARFSQARVQVCKTIKAAARVDVQRLQPPHAPVAPVAPAVFERQRRQPRLVVIGASTGGTEAILRVLAPFPKDGPPTLIVQHMPGDFTEAFAERLDHQTSMQVRQAADGDALLPGTVLIAPGDTHMLVVRHGIEAKVELRAGPLVSRHRPSVDVLFRSTARALHGDAVGVIMTGMGRDGAIGLKELRDAGGRTVGQDERSSVVFGMAKWANNAGAVERLVPLPQLGQEILQMAWAAERRPANR